MRRIGLILAIGCVSTGIVGAQPTTLRKYRPLSSEATEYSSSTVFDGPTITHEVFETDGSSTHRSRSSALVAELDLARSNVRVENGYPFLEFWCNAGLRCWSYGPGYEAYINHDVSCPSIEECHAFLQRLRDAVDVRRAPPPEQTRPDAPPETVIDGSNIPSRIDFASPSAPSATSAPARTAPSPPPTLPPPAPDPPTATAGPPDVGTPGRALPSGTGARSINDILDDLDSDAGGRSNDSAAAPKNWVEENLEGFLTTLFDEWAEREPDDGLFDVMASAFRELVIEESQEFVQEYMQGVLSQQVLGQSWESLPIEFRKDKEFIDATFARVFDPFSLSTAFEHVNKLGELFDLWNER